MNRGQQFFKFSSLFSFLLLMCQGAWASSSGQALPTRFPAQIDRIRKADGDLASRYKVGNGYLIQLNNYIAKMIGKLDDERKNNSSQWDHTVKQNIGSFCLSGESSDDCYDRYKEVQNHTLDAIRAEVAQNNATAALLQSESNPVRAPSGGPQPLVIRAFVRGEHRSDVEQQINQRQESPIFDSASIQQAYESKLSRQQRLIKVDYADFVAAMPRKPAVEDFVKLVRKPASLKGVDDTFALDFNCANPNPICYDEAKYLLAVQRYQADEARFIQLKEKMMDEARQSSEVKTGLYSPKAKLTNVQTQALDEATQSIAKKFEQIKQVAGPNVDLFIQADPNPSNPGSVLTIPLNGREKR